MRGALIALLVVVSFSPCFSQSVPGQSGNVEELNKYRIAQALEQAGEYEKALDFYRELYRSFPNNIVYFDGLRRIYVALKKYDDAKQLLESRLAAEPSNVVLICQLGDTYFKNAQADSASIVWDKGLAIDPKNPNTYRAVAGAMADNRLFDEAVEVYRKGESSGIPGLTFSNDIARLYFLHAEYAQSLRELLNQLQGQRTPFVLSNIEAEIGTYSSSKDAVEQFTLEMEKQVSAHPDDADFRRLLGFLYMETKNYSAAYSTYKWLDGHSGSVGSELFQFAANAYYAEAYDVAANAYMEAAGLSKDKSVVAQSLLGNAASLQRWGEKDFVDDDRPCSTTDSLPELNKALSVYERIIDEFPQTQYSSAAALQSVELKMQYFHDFSDAEKLVSDVGDRGVTNEVALLRVRLYLKEGKIQAALSSASEFINSNPRAGEPLFDRMELEAAMSLYYLGLYDSSIFYLNKIALNPMSDAANDAIQLLNTITNNKGNPPALREFASASAMEESKRIPEAAAALEKVLNDYPGVSLSDNARFDLAADYCRMGNIAEALKDYSTLAEDSTGVFADKAAYRICRIYQETLHQNEKAITGYEDFLRRFPNSIYQNKVREILRDLLGENS